MPTQVKTICPGCRRAIVPKGERCEGCKPKQYKGTSKNRSGDPFYSTAAWKKLRLAYLREHPLCECDECKRTKAVTAADVVDHIQPRCDHPELSLEWSNLRSMKAAHHNAHTARTRRRDDDATR